MPLFFLVFLTKIDVVALQYYGIVYLKHKKDKQANKNKALQKTNAIALDILPKKPFKSKVIL
jgi:hypothetical protein